jgi:hypothetical protein
MTLDDAVIHVSGQPISTVTIETDFDELSDPPPDRFRWRFPKGFVEKLPFGEKFAIESMWGNPESDRHLYLSAKDGYRIRKTDAPEWFEAESLHINPATNRPGFS